MVGKIERVQKKYLKFVCYNQKIMYSNYDYVSLCKMFNLSTLQSRRNCTDASFLNKLCQNKVKCSYLIGEINLNAVFRTVPTRITRSFKPHYQCKLTFLTEYRILCRKHSFMPRVLDLANTYDLYDRIVMDSPNVFKSFIRSVL